MGFYKKKLIIQVLYKGKWYNASSVMIGKDGTIDIEYCHGLNGSIDPEFVDKIILIVKNDKHGNQNRI